MEVHWCHHGDQISHALGMEDGKAQAQHPALADPEDIQSIQPVYPQDVLDAAGEKVVDIIAERGEPVRLVRAAPGMALTCAGRAVPCSPQLVACVHCAAHVAAARRISGAASAY